MATDTLAAHVAEDVRVEPSRGYAAVPRFAPAEVHSAVTQFLVYEAMLLDQDRLTEWLDLLDDSFVYSIPLRHDRERKQGGNSFVAGSYRIHDSKKALGYRISRLNTGHAWVEELPSRTSRLVGSVAVMPADKPDVYEAISSIILYRQHGDQRDFEIIPARHEDVLKRQADGSFRFLSRAVFLTEKCLSTNNLAIIV